MNSRHTTPSPRSASSLQNMCFVVLVALTASACSSSTESVATPSDPEQTSQPEYLPTTEPSPVIEAAPSESDPAPESVPNQAGAYISLAEYQASQVSYAGSKVVLFFNATWCSTCKKARSNLEADLSAIPDDIAIVLVDFDSETALRRQYGVTVQHTFVQIDAEGNELAKWSGSLTAQEIAKKTV